MQRLSIIVPLMGDSKRFEETLLSVLENQPEQSEVVVVLNDPYDDPYELQGEVKFVEAEQGADLVNCFARGLAASNAPVVHILAAGFEATPGWADAALENFSEPLVAAVAPVVIDRDAPDRILSAGLCYSSAGTIRPIAAGRHREQFVADDRVLCGPEMCVAFFRRDALDVVETLQSYRSERAAAIDLALAVRKAGYRSVQDPRCVTTATADLLASGSAWGEGVSSERLFRRWTGSWAAHLGLVALELLQSPLRPSNLSRLAGRAWAMLGFGAKQTVAIAPQVAANQSEVLIRSPHFKAADARPAVPSRAAG